MYVCMYVCMYVYMYRFMYVYIYVCIKDSKYLPAFNPKLTLVRAEFDPDSTLVRP